MDSLRRHCRATAHLSRIVSQHTSKAEDQAFLCGLLHDVGIAGILLVLGDVERGKKPPDLTPLWPAIDAAHAKAGARMVVLWGLPPEIAMAVGAHHQVRIGADFDHPVAATICLAEALATELDLGLAPSRDGEHEPTEPDLAGLLLHDGIDKSDAVTLGRAREALALDEPKYDLVRLSAAKWAQSADGAAG